MRGWVYVITNKAMPNLLKVGFSTKDPKVFRATELNNTNNPKPFEVQYDLLVDEPRNVEKAVHILLKDYHDGKEWFNCTVEIAIAAIEEAASKIGRFIAQDGIATDIETDLMWCRFAYGQSWFNNTTVGNINKVDWYNAWEVVEQFNQHGGYAGYRDWRLPTMDELKTLIDKDKGKEGNYIDTDVFPNNDAVLCNNEFSE